MVAYTFIAPDYKEKVKEYLNHNIFSYFVHRLLC